MLRFFSAAKCVNSFMGSLPSVTKGLEVVGELGKTGEGRHIYREGYEVAKADLGYCTILQSANSVE